MKYDVIQIGANVGHTDNDPVYPKVLAGEIKTGFLIEANPKCLPFLREVYKDYKGITTHNLAISDHIGTLKFFVDNYDKDKGTSQHASVSRDFQIAHEHGKSDVIHEIEVPCTTLEAFYEEQGISEIEWLFVDAEGHDYNILIAVDFNKVSAKRIYFESLHTDGPHKRGANYARLIDQLRSFGYTLHEEHVGNTILSK